MFVKKSILCVILYISIIPSINTKTYEKCELVRELIEKYDFKDEDAVRASCTAEGTGFETNRISYYSDIDAHYNYDGKKSNNNNKYKTSYGIFRISSEYWCSETGVGGICNINCKDLIDDDISNDVDCLKKIVTDSYAWQAWPESQSDCYWEELLKLCNVTTSDTPPILFERTHPVWKSLDECLTDFPQFYYPYFEFGFGGRPALKHEFPHATAIGWSRPDSNDIKWACGGSLITEDTVLTAAHCTFNREGTEPDVVRLGDLNLIDDEDAKDTQQFTVDTIIRHPEYKPRYNDIALIKLKKRVNVTNFVMPACLWTQQTIPRDIQLEACGFGQTEFLGDISPVLNKVVVSTVTTNTCQTHYENDRKLKDELSERIHLCADDKSGKRMDTCEGDSGGPLEMKLYYYNNLIPYVVGVTAFGKGCGFDTPGVYTRVSSYIEWIKQHVPEIETDAYKCAVKYKNYRFYELRYYETTFEPQKTIVGDQPNQNTTGIIISDRFLLAAASNLEKISNPNRVLLITNASQIFIDKIINHPKYVKGNFENDLALVKLKTPIRWFYHDHPTCLSKDHIQKIASQQEKYIEHLSTRFKPVNLANSTVKCYSEDRIDVDFDTSDTFLCYKNDHYQVPGFCDVVYGSPIYHKYNKFPYQSIVQGLAEQSDECSFTFAINLSSHLDWINSVVFGGSLETETRVDNDDISVVFRDADLVLGDSCEQKNGEQGVCTRRSECKKKLSGQILLCSGDAVCC